MHKINKLHTEICYIEDITMTVMSVALPVHLEIFQISEQGLAKHFH